MRQRLTLGMAMFAISILVASPRMVGGSKSSNPLVATGPDTPAKLLYILKPEGFGNDSTAQTDFLLDLQTQVAGKLTEERVRSRLHGGDTCNPGEKCDDVVILRKDTPEFKGYKVTIFCKVHTVGENIPTVESDTVPFKISRFLAKHDINHP